MPSQDRLARGYAKRPVGRHLAAELKRQEDERKRAEAVLKGAAERRRERRNMTEPKKKGKR